VVGLGIGLAAQLRYHRAVNLHVAGGNQLLSLAAGGNSSGSDNFLQTLKRHDY